MNIYVLDGLNGIVNLIDTFESVIWNVQFYDVNDFELTVPGTQKNIQTLVEGALLVRDFDISEDGYHNVMKIQNREITFDIEKGWIMTVTGGGLKTILKQRIVWAQTNLTGSVESGIRSVITENIINPSDTDRTIDDFILEEAQGFTDTFDIQLLGENIADWLVELCPVYGFGWDVYIKEGKYVFTLKKGVNRTYDQSAVMPVVFSPEYDNLFTARYIYEKADYKNAALVGGEGEGTAKRTATIGTATGLDRYETYIDGSGVSSNGEIITVETYMAMLQDFGIQQLSGTMFTESFEGAINTEGIYKINEDYFLGDIIQIDNGLIAATSRIIETIYCEDANGNSLTCTFSNWGE